MHALDRRLVAALVLVGVLACGGEKPPAPAPRAEPAPAATPPPAAQPDPDAAVTGAERAAAATPTAPAKPAAKPDAVPAQAPAPKPPAAPVADVPAAPAKPAPKPDPVAAPAPPAAAPGASAHAKVGADKCRMCHRVQHQSWAESAHAKKGLDCEACHGNGSDYWPASVMRDRAKAVAAGLVLPGVDRCRACHPKADASLLPKAHAHKAR
jgi:outer membrane biosynthesis protein TonB